MKEWADIRQNRRQKVDAEEVAYTQRAVSGSLSFCTTSTDEKTDEERNGTAGGTPSFLKRYIRPR